MKSIPTLAFATVLTALSGLSALANPSHAGHQQHRHSGPIPAPAQSEAMMAYGEAMEKMHGPMMQAIQNPDPDVAFVKGMIPHHQGAIDMARIVLQHGKDEQAKKWANDVIREQEREIREMREWLKARGVE